MDVESIPFIFMVLLWVLSRFVAKFAKKPQSELPEGETSPHRADRGEVVQKALRELAEQMGVEIEVAPAEAPVASEHAQTRSEHRRTRTETRGTPSEHLEVAAEHRQAVSELSRTASEAAMPAAEHNWTMSEHRHGDVEVSRPPISAPSVSSGRRSAFGRRLRRDLSGRGGSLARAIVLREILGPPVSLRSSGEDRA